MESTQRKVLFFNFFCVGHTDNCAYEKLMAPCTNCFENMDDYLKKKYIMLDRLK
jgi:hypothetical protein